MNNKNLKNNFHKTERLTKFFKSLSLYWFCHSFLVLYLTVRHCICIYACYHLNRQSVMVLTSSVIGDCCSLGCVGVGSGWASLRRVADLGDRIWESQWGHFTTDLFWPSLTTLLVSNILQRTILYTLKCHTVYNTDEKIPLLPKLSIIVFLF